jgi:hypothetical protein
VGRDEVAPQRQPVPQIRGERVRGSALGIGAPVDGREGRQLPVLEATAAQAERVGGDLREREGQEEGGGRDL